MPILMDADGQPCTGDIDFQETINLGFLKYEGPVDPKITGGFENTFKYRNWTFSFFINYQFGNKVRLYDYFKSEYSDTVSYTHLDVYKRQEYGSSEENVSWNPALVFLADPTDYAMADYTAHPTDHPFYASPLFYDNLNGRFAFNQQGGFFSSLAGVDSDFSKFDPNNMGKGVKMILSGSMNSTLDEVWALMKD